MKEWEKDKRWSDRFLPEIKSILGLYLISEPPVEEDQERNTDLMVLRMDAVRVGCRVRKADYMNRYGNEFTIRAGRPNGNKTELTKIIEGWGDYFFYGFANNTHIVKWTLGNLNVFRLWFNRHICSNGGKLPGIGKPNKDGSSHFLAFNWNDLPDNFIIGKSE